MKNPQNTPQTSENTPQTPSKPLDNDCIMHCRIYHISQYKIKPVLYLQESIFWVKSVILVKNPQNTPQTPSKPPQYQISNTKLNQFYGYKNPFFGHRKPPKTHRKPHPNHMIMIVSCIVGYTRHPNTKLNQFLCLQESIFWVKSVLLVKKPSKHTANLRKHTANPIQTTW